MADADPARYGAGEAVCVDSPELPREGCRDACLRQDGYAGVRRSIPEGGMAGYAVRQTDDAETQVLQCYSPGRGRQDGYGHAGFHGVECDVGTEESLGAHE